MRRTRKRRRRSSWILQQLKKFSLMKVGWSVNHKRPLKDKFLSEMRQKYDQGEDPLDPENGRGGGGGHPFRQGGHTFHFPGSLWYFFRLLISTSRWPSLWWRAVQVPLQLANVTGHSFIATWLWRWHCPLTPLLVTISGHSRRFHKLHRSCYPIAFLLPLGNAVGGVGK